jgi:hypothetical protein
MTTSPQVGRFFSFKNAAMAVAVLLGGLGFGGYVVLRIVNENRVSIGGLAVSGLLVLVGLGLFFTVFPKGCKRCAKPFEETSRETLGEHYQLVQGALSQGDAAKIQWALQSTPAGAQKTTVTVSYCKGCRSVGVASVALERSNGDDDETVASSGDIAIGPPVIHALTA